MKLLFGEKKVPEPSRNRNDVDNAWGPAWHAWREGAGFVLEYDSGSIGGRCRRIAISAEEFSRLHADPDAFLAIARGHGG